MKVVEREKARKLRSHGKSINQIVAETGFAKGSVSLWVRDIVLSEKHKKGISLRGRSVASIEKRRLSRLFNQSEKERRIRESAKTDIQKISLHELKLIGTILYLGEGTKRRGMVRVTNSDPGTIKIMMRFFREICMVPEQKFRAYVHTFSHADIEKTEQYWSKITSISRKRFYKTYIKPSVASLQKRKTLPYGTLDISICDTHLFHTIMGWIEKIKELVIQ